MCVGAEASKTAMVYSWDGGSVGWRRHRFWVSVWEVSEEDDERQHWKGGLVPWWKELRLCVVFHTHDFEIHPIGNEHY